MLPLRVFPRQRLCSFAVQYVQEHEPKNFQNLPFALCITQIQGFDLRLFQVRTLYEGYVRAVEAYFAVLIPKIAKHQYRKGGAVVAVQVENEYGAYGSDKVLVNVVNVMNLVLS